MITAPIAVYRPRTASLMLASGEASMIVAEGSATRLSAALRRVSTMVSRGGTIGLRNPTGRLSLHGDQPLALADAIDAALAIPIIAGRLQAERP